MNLGLFLTLVSGCPLLLRIGENHISLIVIDLLSQVWIVYAHVEQLWKQPTDVFYRNRCS